MMDGHYASAKKIKSRYPPNSLYYLEIAAVKPDTQGMGVGGAMMSWVVDRLGKSPCFLECTNEKNIAFYEKYGFKLLEEKTLSHGAAQSSTTLYYMVRDKASLGL
jgi:ribosomal protein S18 acetylase RimI-like enzyme